MDYVRTILSATGVFPVLKATRVVVGQVECRTTLRALAIASKQFMMEGNPLTTISACGRRRGMDRGLRVDWEECYEAEGIRIYRLNKPRSPPWSIPVCVLSCGGGGRHPSWKWNGHVRSLSLSASHYEHLEHAYTHGWLTSRQRASRFGSRWGSIPMISSQLVS